MYNEKKYYKKLHETVGLLQTACDNLFGAMDLIANQNPHTAHHLDNYRKELADIAKKIADIKDNR